MRESIREYCSLGIVHSMAFPDSQKSADAYLSTLKELLKDDYFEVIEIGALPFAQLNTVVPPLIRSAHADLTYSGHSRLFSQKLNINSLDEIERERAVETLKEGIDEAYSWGALNFQFLSREFEEQTKEKSLDALVRSTLELCEYAKKKGEMKICLEIFDYDIDKRSLIGPAFLAAEYAARVTARYDNFGLMVDCSHIPMIHETIDEAIDPVKEFIVHAHMGNTLISDPSDPSYGDNHPPFGYPESENDTAYLAQYLKKMLSVGYLDKEKRPVLSFEVKPQHNQDPHIVIANAKRTLRDAWRMV
ncbi:MAG: TIM barrel protein [Sphaerochaetaceae bacterium]|nr:TIM barrel protein [Sphaerochaetaceae bacterium]